MRQITFTLYQYNELSEEAKKKVRKPYLEYVNDIWRRPVFKDFKNVGKCLGFEVYNFEEVKECWYPIGRMDFEPEMVQKIRSYAPLDETLHAIAEEFLRLQSECKFTLNTFFYLIYERVNGEHLIRCLSCERNGGIWDRRENTEFLVVFIGTVAGSLNIWLNDQLQKEWVRVTSEQAIREYCIANELEFFENGNAYVK